MDNLTLRMKTAVSLMPRGGSVADIGCDHGYVAIALSKSKKFDRVIASDINFGPLDAAQRNIAQSCADVETRLSDGFSAYTPGEIDRAVIAGLGGDLMMDILSRGDLSKIKYMVLSPQSVIDEVRKYLHQNCWRIEDEKLCLDGGKYYTAMLTARGDDEKYTEFEYIVGKRLLDKNESPLRDYIVYLKSKFETRLSGLLSAKVRDFELIDYYKSIIHESEVFLNENK